MPAHGGAWRFAATVVTSAMPPGRRGTKSRLGGKRMGVGRSRRGGFTVASLVALLTVAAGLSAAAGTRPGRTEWVSPPFHGGPNEFGTWSDYPSISDDGRYVAFHSDVDLIPEDENGVDDIFVYDRHTRVIERVSIASDGTGANVPSDGPTISGDGRYVAFYSEASKLVDGDTNDAGDYFVHDRTTGRTERVSVASDGSEAQGDHYLLGGGEAGSRWYGPRAAISRDGRYVAFGSAASNLVPEDPSGGEDVFLHDLQTGTTEVVSVMSDGTGFCVAGSPSLSDDGRYVAFEAGPCSDTGLFPRATAQVFVHDRATGRTELVSMNDLGDKGTGDSLRPSISADGRYVAFWSPASNLVPSDTNGLARDSVLGADIFVHDRFTEVTERVSVASDGSEADVGWFGRPSISADGRYVAFDSNASNLVADDTNQAGDAFVHDRLTGETKRVSITSDGYQAEGAPGSPNGPHSYGPVLSADGRYVAFASMAFNLLPDDTDGSVDAFVRDRGPSLGVGEVDAAVTQTGDQVEVAGWATRSGAVVSAAKDPAVDGGLGARPTGGELTGASVAYRPESEDLLLRIKVWRLPRPRVPDTSDTGIGRRDDAEALLAGFPGVLYGFRLRTPAGAYEVRVLKGAATAAPPSAPYFGLYRCDAQCAEVGRLTGGYGTTGHEIRVSLPLAALELSAGSAVTDLNAFSGLGEAASGSVRVFDEVDLADTSIPPTTIELGIAPQGTAPAEVEFDRAVGLTGEGKFHGFLEIFDLQPGRYDVWARACLGDTCDGAASTTIDVG